MMKAFCMIRNDDESGTSGTGKVLEGVEFSNGKVAISWCSEKTPVSSTTVFDTFDEFKKIHIDQHPTNGTEIEWYGIAEVKKRKQKPKEIEELYG